jgi:putative ABC transport system permease protein
MSLRRFLHRARWDEERAEELESYLAIEIDENIARGLAPGEARAAAVRKLGNRTRVREEIYDMNTIGWIDEIWRDVKYAARLLRINKGFAAIAVLSLALGFGANTAIFELLNALRLRALPVSHPEQLARIRIENDSGMSGGFDGRHPNLTNPLWETLRQGQQAFSDLFAWGTPNFELTAGGISRIAAGLWVSGDYFTTLGVRPLIGRLLTASDDRRGCAAPPAVISYGFWQQEYAGSLSVLGQTLTLDRHPYEIVGVTPADFFGVEVGHTFDVAVPLCAEPYSNPLSNLDRKDNWFLAAIGRLKPGWSSTRATAHLEAISPALFRATLPNYRPEDEKAYLAFRLGAFPAATGVSDVRSDFEAPLWLLLATAALVLLIACANLANLMLARATAREREVAVRLALGASRGRIVRQMAAESALIALCGAAAGALLARWLTSVLVASIATERERIFLAVEHDWRVFAFIGLVASASCVIFGVVPALRATRMNAAAVMKAGGRGSTDTHERFRLRRVLVVVQVALSLALIVGALLFVRTFRNLATLDTGFVKDHLLVAEMNFRQAGITRDRLAAVYREVLERARRVPGVESAAQVRNVPIGGSFSNRDIIIDGVSRPEHSNFNAVSDRYFQTMGIALIAGRDVADRDAAAAPKVAIVSESFARVYFGGANPLGRTFQIDVAPGIQRPTYTIVGLARDTTYNDLRLPFAPEFYAPAVQDPQYPLGSLKVIIRSSQPLETVTGAVAALAREENPAIVVDFRTMASRLHDSLLRERLMATLSGFFGGLAALIAAIGLYGVMSYTVARRRNEIGVRIALGADRRQVMRMVMGEAGGLVAAGLAIGVPAALAVTRFASALLFGVTPRDPATLGAAVAGLALVAALASYVPALRASRLEPIEALRDE